MLVPDIRSADLDVTDPGLGESASQEALPSVGIGLFLTDPASDP